MDAANAPAEAATEPPDASATDASVGGWSWVNPLPQGNTLHAIWESAPNDVWAVGDLGSMVHFDGATWTPWPSGTTCGLRSMWGSAANDVWAVGDCGTVLHWNGTTWSPVPSGTTSDLIDLWGIGPSAIWAAGTGNVADPGVLQQWDGTSFSTAFTNASATFDAVWASSASDVWVVGQGPGGGVKYWNWNGQAWTNPTAPFLETTGMSLWGSGPNDIWSPPFYWNGSFWTDTTGTSRYLGYGGSMGGTGPNDVWTSSGGHWDGASWTTFDCGGGDVAGSTFGDLWFVGKSGAVSHWDGSACTPSTPASWSNAAFRAVTAIGPKDVYLVSDQVRHWDGATWTTSTVPIPANYQATVWDTIWGSSNIDIWIGAMLPGAAGTAQYGALSHWDGTAWSSPTILGNEESIMGIWGSASNDVWAVTQARLGATSHSWHWDGSTWTSVVTGPHNGGTAVWGSSATDVWIAGGPMTHWDGTTWTLETSAPVGLIWGSGPTDVWVVSADPDASSASDVYHYDGVHWAEVATLPFNATQISGSGPSDAWVSGNGGAAWHWDGTSWSGTVTGTDTDLYGIASTGPGQAWAVGSPTVLRFMR